MVAWRTAVVVALVSCCSVVQADAELMSEVAQDAEIPTSFWTGRHLLKHHRAHYHAKRHRSKPGKKGPHTPRASISCPSPPSPVHGSCSGGTRPGSKAMCTCKAGYSLSGSVTRSCNNLGWWTGSTPTCKVKINSARDGTFSGKDRWVIGQDNV